MENESKRNLDLLNKKLQHYFQNKQSLEDPVHSLIIQIWIKIPDMFISSLLAENMSWDNISRIIRIQIDEDLTFANNTDDTIVGKDVQKSIDKPELCSDSSNCSSDGSVQFESNNDPPVNLILVKNCQRPQGNKRKNTDTEVREHNKMHTNVTNLKCKLCGNILKSRHLYYKHMRSHKEVRSHKCDQCESAFFDKYTLRKHTKTHSGLKPFQCRICNKCFTSKNYLEKHIDIHNGVKACQCDVCGKTFSSTCNLSNHVRIHTGEKPFTCDICGKSFTEKSSLRKHMKIHSNEKPHVCNVCQRAFRFRSTLVEHIRIHTGERPYVCDICNKSFKHYSSRMKHKRLHTRDTVSSFDEHQTTWSVKQL